MRIYVEGGGDKKDTRAMMRTAFDMFLGSVKARARSHSIRWSTVMCGGRGSTYDDFVNGVIDHPKALNILLVDAECPVTSAPAKHLEKLDNWSFGAGLHSNCHLMVQLMESWFLADRQVLISYYGDGFRENQLPKGAGVEAIPKEDVLKGLAHASAKTQKGAYRKVIHGAALLERTDPQQVRSAAPHCEALFTFFENAIQ